MTWRQFEMLVGESFRRRGFTITETGGNGPDGGVDLILSKAGERYLVQLWVFLHGVLCYLKDVLKEKSRPSTHDGGRAGTDPLELARP
jgi:hypothetical protein